LGVGLCRWTAEIGAEFDGVGSKIHRDFDPGFLCACHGRKLKIYPDAILENGETQCEFDFFFLKRKEGIGFSCD